MSTVIEALQAMPSAGGGQRESLRAALNHAAHALPIQGPIGVFIHHNTLHAFQHMPFDRAVVEAGALFGAEPYMREEAFRRAIASGRIKEADIECVLDREPNHEVLGKQLDRRALRKRMLLPGVRHFQPSRIEWQMTEENLAETLRPDLPDDVRELITAGTTESQAARRLFGECRQRVPQAARAPRSRAALRPRDAIFQTHDVDIDLVVNPWLIRLCSVFLDQGQAYWRMPRRDRGLYVAVRELFALPSHLHPRYLDGLDTEFRRQSKNGLSGEDAVLEMLAELGVSAARWEEFLTAELLALPGWAGLVQRLELEPQLAPYEAVSATLVDYLAVRLTLVLVAGRNIGGGKLPAWRGVAMESNDDPSAVRQCRVAQLFDAAQLVGLSATEMHSLSNEEFRRLLEEVELFDGLERRRILQLAYENRHDHQVLGPLAAHRREQPPTEFASRPFAQVFCCIDDREESLRRHLEEVAPDIETFAYAGFFSVAMEYAGIDDSLASSLCPVIVKPKHAVREKPIMEDHDVHRQRLLRRKVWASALHNLHVSPRTMVRGWLTSLLGAATLVPLVGRVLMPRAYGRMRDWVEHRVFPSPRTEVTLVRSDDHHNQHQHHKISPGLFLGFTEEEQADRVENVLRPAGLVRGFSRLVVVLGHGSTSINNPHESAYDCGACGGRSGGPNARLFAQMANHGGVRHLLRKRGIELPEDIHFLGGHHDTCSDQVELFDLDLVPATHQADVERITASLDRARELDAHERTRRFEAAPLDHTPEEALRHAEERSEHLAEPRSECGHATNAVCIVGRRALTRGLFLDRRAFLVSYDAHQDPDDVSLAKLLAPAVPVCAGINLEYYFSYVDNEKYGCGTKLPHNVTGLVGVMNGPASDLRTGLPWQMVEIHEPVRILFVIESTPDRVLRTFHNSAELTEFLENRWIRLATIDPDDGTIHIYRGPHFEKVLSFDAEVPVAESSAAWYRGRREHLALARIVGRHKAAA